MFDPFLKTNAKFVHLYSCVVFVSYVYYFFILSFLFLSLYFLCLSGYCQLTALFIDLEIFLFLIKH